MTWSLWIPGRPRSTQTGKLVGAPAVMLQTSVGLVKIRKARMFPKREGQEWMAKVLALATQARPPVMLSGPLELRAWFYFIPPAPPKKPRKDAKPLPPIPTHVDTGNLIKGVLDQLRDVVITDDCWIADDHTFKRWGEADGVRIALRRAPGFE